MNDEPPSNKITPSQTPLPKEQKPAPLPPPEPPSFWLMFFLGIILVICSAFASGGMQSPVPFFLLAAGAVLSLFFQGYRGLFVGFATVLGLVFLVLVVVCGPMHLS